MPIRLDADSSSRRPSVDVNELGTSELVASLSHGSIVKFVTLESTTALTAAATIPIYSAVVTILANAGKLK
jgi:hypothetical protein